TLFSPTHVFQARLRKSLSIPDVQRILIADVDRALDRLPKLYWYALSDADRKLDASGQLTDQAATDALREFTGDWSTFAQNFNAWVSAGNNRLPLFQVFTGGGVLKGLNDIDSNSALIFSSTGRPPSWDVLNGTITFRVADPIRNLDDSGQYVVSIAHSTDQK